MQITLKLYAMLTQYLPAGAEKNISRLELPEDTTVGAVIKQLRMPEELVHLVLLNGVYVEPARLDETPLNDSDVLAVWPPVAGG